MERQKTLWELVSKKEMVLNEENLEELYWKEGEEPCDLADQAYEQWRDENRS
jgi:hypothetical protein